MVAKIAKIPSGKTATETAAPALPKTPTPGQPPNVTVTADAATSAIAFGGNKGGRGRADGLVPGSPEAKAADLKKDAIRKSAARKVAQTITQPALPSALPSTPSPSLPVVTGAPGGDTVLGTAKAPWTGKMVEPAAKQIVGFWEDSRLSDLEKKAMEANLSEPLRRDILQDARFPTEAKEGVIGGSSDLTAEALNAVGLDSKWNRVMGLITGYLIIAKSGSDVNKRLDELIALQKEAKKGTA